MQAEEIFINAAGQKVNPEAFRTDKDGTTHGQRLTLEQLAGIGITPLTIYERPDDYSDETYYRDENQPAPKYIAYNKKSAEQLDQVHNSKIKAQIAAIESGQARAVREAALGNTQHLQDIETAVVLLRGQLKPEPVEPTPEVQP